MVSLKVTEGVCVPMSPAFPQNSLCSPQSFLRRSAPHTSLHPIRPLHSYTPTPLLRLNPSLTSLETYTPLHPIHPTTAQQTPTQKHSNNDLSRSRSLRRSVRSLFSRSASRNRSRSSNQLWAEGSLTRPRMRLHRGIVIMHWNSCV